MADQTPPDLTAIQARADAARTDVPALLAEIQRLRAELDQTADRLYHAELICRIKGITAHRADSDEEKAAFAVWRVWKRLPGVNRQIDDLREMVPELARMYDESRAKTIARLREEHGPEAAAFYANGGGSIAAAGGLLAEMVRRHSEETGNSTPTQEQP